MYNGGYIYFKKLVHKNTLTFFEISNRTLIVLIVMIGADFFKSIQILISVNQAIISQISVLS
ncbi:MAG: hypothetical protein DRR16_29880 [Candidatus Parabeggiatoa sp. nov. 3]|nr:MAG: hypothetical protein DRR00_24520 [Gammaproteobacteria bacterium]RKZ60874.1 MAG: hypothetical protein DRQ99_21380 [Gammaproteobacteria bacterium]RKZ77151.1 MAG: hypothetical protein DRR16_29880 [Gammaproteobacteria bacterium]